MKAFAPCGTLLLFFLSGGLLAQTKAITSNGDEIIVYDDGTWKYSKKPDEVKIETNAKLMVKPALATFPVKSNRINVQIFLDPKKWEFEKKEETAEYNFKGRNNDLYGMLITEKIAVPVEKLVDIAIDNARAAAPDVEVKKKEYRTVNGTQVLCMQMEGTMQGIRFVYLGYYGSSQSGCFQFLGYTAKNVFDQSSKEIEDLLNGLTML